MGKLEVLAQLDNVKAELDAARPLSQAAIYQLRETLKITHTYDSNAIEGSTLTLRETALVVKEGVTIAGKPIAHMNAARGYAMGFDAIFDFVERDMPLTEDMVKTFHRYVMIGANPMFCGLYRDCNVRIAGSTTKRPDFALVPLLLKELIRWWENDAKQLHPIEAVAHFHARFEDIHPFVDGNGRTGRLLLNYQLIKAGYWPINIRYADERLRYYEALEDFDNTKVPTKLIELIAEREIDQLSECLEIARQQDGLV